MLTAEDRKRIEDQKIGILAELCFDKGYTGEELNKVLDSGILDINEKIVKYVENETENLPEEAASFLKKHILNEYDIISYYLIYYLIFREFEIDPPEKMNWENLSAIMDCLRKWINDLGLNDILAKLHENG